MRRFHLGLLLLVLACDPSAGGPPPAPAEQAHPHDEALVLSAAAVAAARIQSAPVAEGALSPELRLAGRLTLDPRREAVISAWIRGQVDAIGVRPGDAVRAGQVLGTVQSPDLGEAIATFRTAAARDSAADARLERLRRLEADGVASHSQVLEMEADHAEAEGDREAAEERLRIFGVDPSLGDPHAGEHYLSHIPVRCPIAGKVLRAEAAVGRQVEPGDTLFHVGDLSVLWLLLDVYEADLARVSVGQAVRFTVDAWPGQSFVGGVDQVGDWVDPVARTIQLRVLVENADERLKPNMYAQAAVLLADPQAPRGLLLPEEALATVENRAVVFVEEEAGRYEARPVTLLGQSGGAVLLAPDQGVAVGDRVVVSGAFTLQSELAKGELGEGHGH